MEAATTAPSFHTTTMNSAAEAEPDHINDGAFGGDCRLAKKSLLACGTERDSPPKARASNDPACDFLSPQTNINPNLAVFFHICILVHYLVFVRRGWWFIVRHLPAELAFLGIGSSVSELARLVDELFVCFGAGSDDFLEACTQSSTPSKPRILSLPPLTSPVSRGFEVFWEAVLSLDDALVELWTSQNTSCHSTGPG